MARFRRDNLAFEGGDDAIRDRSAEPRTKRAARWDLVLVWYMRLLALLWIAKGLSAWALILGAGYPVPPFEARLHRPPGDDHLFRGHRPVAAVGLWLGNVWGGVMWLLADHEPPHPVLLLPLGGAEQHGLDRASSSPSSSPTSPSRGSRPGRRADRVNLKFIVKGSSG